MRSNLGDFDCKVKFYEDLMNMITQTMQLRI